MTKYQKRISGLLLKQLVEPGTAGIKQSAEMEKVANALYQGVDAGLLAAAWVAVLGTVLSTVEEG